MVGVGFFRGGARGVPLVGVVREAGWEGGLVVPVCVVLVLVRERFLFFARACRAWLGGIFSEMPQMYMWV